MISRAACRFSSCWDGGGILLLVGGQGKLDAKWSVLRERKDVRGVMKR